MGHGIVVVQYAAGAVVVACVGGTVLSLLGILVATARSFRQGMVEAETAHRAARGRCMRCGYRLIGNTSGVCPECGRPRAGSPTPPAEVRHD